MVKDDINEIVVNLEYNYSVINYLFSFIFYEI